MTDAEQPLNRVPTIRAILLSLFFVMIIGAWAGFFSDGDFARAFTLTAAIGAVVTGAVLFQLIRDARRVAADMGSMPSSERRSTWMTMGWFAAGVIIAAIALAFGGSNSTDFPAIGSVTPITAGVLAMLVMTVGPWTTWLWWRATDEHERQAYLEGAHVAASAALYLGIGWWLLSRAALLPPPDGMAILIGLSVIWSAVWLWRKYS